MSEDTSTPLVKYNLTDAAIAEMEKEYLPLTIKGLEDKGGLASVHDARIVVKKTMTEVEKTRKDLKADALRFGREVDAEAKRIKGRLQPIKDHLAAEENKVKEEKARIKEEKAREEEERLQARVNLLQRFGRQVSIVNLKAMSDEEFQAAYDEAKAEHEAEEARLAQEAKEREEREGAERKERAAKEEEDRKAREAEAARLAAIAEEQDRIAKEQKAVADKIQADQDALAAERQAIDNDKKFEAGKKEAAEAAAQEEREKIQREAEEKEEADRLAKEKAAWQEKWKPDKEKIIAYAEALLAVPAPHVVSEEAKGIMEFTDSELSKLAGNISKYVENI